MSELVWIAVPGGLVSDQVRLRVVVVPRLQDGGLATLDNWAARVARADFAPEVEFDGERTPLAGPPGVDADAAIWAAFIPPATRLLPWRARGPRDANLVVAPSSAGAAGLTKAYRAASRDSGAVGPVRGLLDEVLALQPEPGGATTGTMPTADIRPRPDFHEIVAALREHPRIMRALGLIFDVVVGVPAGGSGEVRVRWPASPVPVRSPATRWVIERGRFLPASRDGGLVRDGVVDLRDPAAWRLATLDIEDGMAKARAAVQGPSTAMLPALRTAGISLLRTDRQADFASRSSTAKARAESDVESHPLFADDLVLGYRPDIRIRGRDRWYSLTARSATYTVDDLDIARDHPEEGHQKPFAMLRRSPDTDRLEADEVVVRWMGWSIAAARPAGGDRGSAMPTPAGIEQPRREQPLFRFDWDLREPPGRSQLPLRFGFEYEMRIRVADLAGEGLRPDDPDDPVESAGTDPIPFLRHEPVPPPLVEPVDERALGPGAGPDTMIVRSDRGMSAAQFLAAWPTYPDNSRRVLLPPATTAEMAELHGIFDGGGEHAWRNAQRAGMAGGPSTLPDPMSSGVVARLREPDVAGTVGWPGDWPNHGPVPVLLEPGEPGDPETTVFDRDGAIVVRLAQGETAELDVSSYLLLTDEPLFQVRNWRDAPLDGHRLVTPGHPLRLVHAVRKPLRNPAAPLRAEREADQTTVRIVPEVDWFGVHRPSTAQIDVAARWSEWGDSDQPLPMPGPRSFPSLTVPIDEPPAAVLVHDFGDTRRRDVEYTLTAVGRHRACFSDAGPEPFLARATVPVVVPNAGTPPRLAVRSVVPGFLWSGPTELAGADEVVLLRHGGRLRVELDHPWHATGADEQVAIVLSATGGTVASRLGRDPLWNSGTARLAPPTGREPQVVENPDTDEVLQILPFPVFLHDGRWYADVELSPSASYAPLVRLALARYQPVSVPGRHLSPVVHTDFVPLLPDRRLVISRAPNGLEIRLDGVGPGGDRASLVTAVLERRRVGAEGALTAIGRADAAAWAPVGGVVTGVLNSAILVPSLPADGSETRLVVREAEAFEAHQPPTTPAGGLADRTTYLAHVAVGN